MPPGYEIVDTRTVRGPDGQEHDVLDAIQALPWREQLCPFMRHEYSIRGKGPDWAWDVLASMLLAKNPDSFRAYPRLPDSESVLGRARRTALLAREHVRDRPRAAG